MIQRIQTVYLVLAALASAGLPWVLSLYVDEAGQEVWAKDDLVYLYLFTGSAFLSVITIFTYKKRQNQFVIGRLVILLNFVLLGVLVYRSQILSGGATALEKGIGMMIPLISIVFTALANCSA